MKNNSRESVNSIVREYKKKNITESDAILQISKKMYPLYIRTNRKMIPFDMSIHPNGDLYNVYLETIQYSLKSFKFSPPGVNKEVYSFIPYFTSMFSNRTNSFMKELAKKLHESNQTISIQEKFEELDNESGETNSSLPIQLQCGIDSHIDYNKKLMTNIRSMLSPEEWYIFDHRIRQFSHQSIDKEMKKDNVPFACSHQMIYIKWNRIKEKVARIIKEWKDAPHS